MNETHDATFDGCPVSGCPAARRACKGEDGKPVPFICGYVAAHTPCRSPAHRAEWRAAVAAALAFAGALRALGIAPERNS